MHPKKATRSDWKIQPMPELKIRLQVEEIFTKEEYKYLTWGFIPVSMDDKWFFYLEDDWLHIHRSWKGYCIFQVRLEKFEDGYSIAEAWVNSDPEQRYDKFVLFWISFLIRINQEKDYCCARVIIAFLILIYFQDNLVSVNQYHQQNSFVFKINFIYYLFSNDNFSHRGFHHDLYDFVDDYYCKPVKE